MTEVDVSIVAESPTVDLAEPSPIDLTVFQVGLPGAPGSDGMSNLVEFGVVVGASDGSETQIALPSDGQLLVGFSAADPVWVDVTGDMTIDTSGVTTIAAGAVSLAKMANLPAHTLIGNPSGTSGVPQAMDVSAVTTLLGLGSAAFVNTSAFDAAGAATTAQTNAESFATSADATVLSAAESFTTSSITALNLGTASQHATSFFLQAANNLSDVTNAGTARTNLGLASAATLAFSTDTTLSASSDTLIPTQHAVKVYVDTAVTGLLDFEGAIDASTNPNYPAANKGGVWVISVTGLIGGASGLAVDVGDMIVATANNAGGTQAAVGASWSILEHNLVGALLSANNLSDLQSASTARGNLGLGSAATLNTGTGSGAVVLGGTITAGGPTGAGSTIPVITWNAAGQLTAVSTVAVAIGGAAITSGTVALARLPTGTDSSSVVVGGVITAAGPQGDAAHTQVLTWNAAGQLTTVTNTAIAIDASAVNTGTLSVTRGGTGVSNPTAHRFLIGNGSSALTVMAAGTDGQIIVGQTSADPAWETVGGDATLAANGSLTIAASAVTLAKMANLADQRILGNNTGGSAAPVALTGANVMAMLSGNAGAAFSFNSQNVSSVGTLSTNGSTSLVTSAIGTQTASYQALGIADGTTATMNATSILFTGIHLNPTITWTTNPGAFFTAYRGINLTSTLQGGTGSTDTFTGAGWTSLTIAETVATQDTNARTMSTYTAAQINPPTLTVFSGGALTISTLNMVTCAALTVPTGATVATLTNFSIAGPSVTGTLTTWLGVDIATVSGAGTAIGLRCRPQAQFGSSQQTVINTSGVVSKYNNTTTAGVGVAYLVDSQALTGQSALIADTSFTSASTAAAVYRICYYLVTSTASGTGTATLNIKFTDTPGTAKTVSSSAVSMASLANNASGVIIAELGSGSVTYGVSIGGTQGSGRYSLYITCERIQ